MAETPNKFISPQHIKSSAVAVSAAQATFPPTTAPANTALLVTFGPEGGRLTRLVAIPQESVTANNLQAYRDIGTAGVAKYLFNCQTGGMDTVSATDGGAAIDFGYSDDNPLLGQPNERIYVATGIAKAYNFIAEWGDY